jgi:hypothetical protein
VAAATPTKRRRDGDWGEVLSDIRSPIGDEARFLINGNVISRAIGSGIRRRVRSVWAYWNARMYLACFPEGWFRKRTYQRTERILCYTTSNRAREGAHRRADIARRCCPAHLRLRFFERLPPQALASPRVNSATWSFTKSCMLVGALPVSLNRSSVMRSYRPCA